MRKTRLFFFLAILSLAACASYIAPLWQWIHNDSRSVAALPLPDSKVLSVSVGSRWSDNPDMHITMLDGTGAVLEHWEFDRELAPNAAATIEGDIFFANGFGNPVSRFDVQAGTVDNIPLSLSEEMTNPTVSDIRAVGDRLLVLGSVLLAGMGDDTVTTLWVLDSAGNTIDIQMLEEVVFVRPSQKLNDGSLVLRGEIRDVAGSGFIVFRYSDTGLDQINLTPDERYVGADTSGVFLYRNGGEGNHIRFLSWGGQLTAVWPSEYQPTQVLRTVADDVIAFIRGDLQRIAPDGSVVWTRELEYSTVQSGEVFINFDIVERHISPDLRFGAGMLGPDGHMLIGLAKYKGRVHGFVDGQLWIRNQMNLVFERFDTDGNKVKTYQDAPYTRIAQPTVNCYEFVCGFLGDRVEHAGACEFLEAEMNEQNQLVIRNRHCAGILADFGHGVSVFDY